MPEADQDRWLSYAEVGQLLGISASAARMHAKRRGWLRRTPNAIGAHALVLVPLDAAVQRRAAADHPPFVAHKVTEPNGVDQANVQAISSAIATLREQLVTANQWAQAERGRADRAERYLEELRTALADAVAAERITAGEASALRADAARRGRWGLLRRLRWALRARRTR
jgi:hypothetical protein